MRNMTLVEFYDDKALENISGTLYLKPDKVIYLGSRGNKLKRFTGYCREVLKDLGLKTEVEYRTINPNSLDFMINVLSDILRENEVCEFNLTGGEETVLVALGIVYERFPNRVQIHKINLNTGMFLDMDGDNSHGWDGTVPGLSSCWENATSTAMAWNRIWKRQCSCIAAPTSGAMAPAPAPWGSAMNSAPG